MLTYLFEDYFFYIAIEKAQREDYERSEHAVKLQLAGFEDARDGAIGLRSNSFLLRYRWGLISASISGYIPLCDYRDG